MGKCLCLDASVEDKSLGRLVNDDHKTPNCKMRTIVLDGMPHLCLFALRDIAPEEEISYNYGDADRPWPKQFQVTKEQYYPEAVEEESLPLELTSLKTSTTDHSSTEFQVTNEQYYPEAVEEESLPLELTSLKTSTTDRSSTEEKKWL